MNNLHRTMGPRLEAYCDELGLKRQTTAEQYGYKPHNNAPTDPTIGLAMHTMGTRCEGIAWSWLKPIEWNALDIAQADLIAGSLNIDVKGIHQPHHSLLVQQDANPDWAYLLVLGQHPNYQILGWLWGHEAQQSPIKELQPDRPVHVTCQAALSPPEELFDMVSERRP